MEQRFKILRLIGNIYKVLGIIAAVITILSVLGICLFSVVGGAGLSQLGNQFGGNDLGGAGVLGGAVFGILMGILALLYGGIIAIALYGSGEMMFLFIALEENTRATADALKQRS